LDAVRKPSLPSSVIIPRTISGDNAENDDDDDDDAVGAISSES
jgi:hypothetical protein